ncbi:tetratricopeptide repeat protein, partial [Myxococcota bacterium]|nr:tetratricopeptide repeat protein [Myxococcota bacterium]
PYAAFGQDDRIVRVIQIVLGSLSCGLLGMAGWRWVSKSVGLVAGGMLALHGAAIFADLTLQKSVLDIFFVCLLLWLLAVARDIPSLGRFIVLGGVLGLFILNRENVLIWLAIIFPWIWIEWSGHGSKRWKFSAGVVMGLALVLTPVGLRNASISGELHLTTSQFGHNFYIGNNPTADGTYRPLLVYRGDPRVEQQDAILIAERALGRSLSPAEVSGFFTDQAFAYIQSQPWDWVQLLFRKSMLIINAVDWVDTKDQYSFAARSPIMWLGESLLNYGVIAPLVALGLMLMWPTRRSTWVLYGLFAIYTASLLLFYIFGRYRLPATPIALIFAASGLVMLPAYLRSHGGRSIAIVLGVVFAVAIAANWPLSDKQYMRSVTEYNLGNELYAMDDIEEAKNHYREAIRLYPGNALAHQNLGSLLAMEGRSADAVAYFDDALAINEDFTEAHFNRARALMNLGETDRALKSYARGLTTASPTVEILIEVAEAHAEADQKETARLYLEEAFRIDPQSAQLREAMRRLGWEERF